MDCASKLALLESHIGHVFTNKLLGVESLNLDNQQLCYDGKWLRIEKSSRLAIVGDNVADTVLSGRWFEAQNSFGRVFNKGQWTRVQQSLVTNANLAERGFRLGLDAYVITNPGYSGRISTKMMATTVEAIIGAVYLDTGCSLDAACAVMERLGFFDHPFFSSELTSATLDWPARGHTGALTDANLQCRQSFPTKYVV